jgi:hypothetical protein
MRIALSPFALAVLAGGISVAGCTCGAKSSPSSDGGSSATPAASGPVAPGVAASAAIFSAPIAGARLGGGAVVAAGLVVATGTITAVRLDASGGTAWTTELIKGVTWAPDVELKAFPLRVGAAIVWRGPRGGKTMRQLVVVGADGKVLDGPMDIGASACATDDGIAWSDGAPGGKSRVRVRVLGGPTPHEETGPGIAEDFSIVCGAHRVYALTEGEEDAPPRIVPVPTGAAQTLGADVFGKDEQRDLLPYADGDDLGVVRVSAGGLVHVADTQQGRRVVLYREKNRIPVDDDIVAVDVGSKSIFVFYTHDESERCKDERGGASVHALRVAREGEADETIDLTSAECGKEAGPFWTGTASGALVVTWAERTPRIDKTTPPIAGFAYRAMNDTSTVVRIARPADALADAGCEGAKCYALALAREPGADGMKPEAIRVIAYP